MRSTGFPTRIRYIVITTRSSRNASLIEDAARDGNHRRIRGDRGGRPHGLAEKAGRGRAGVSSRSRPLDERGSKWHPRSILRTTAFRRRGTRFVRDQPVARVATQRPARVAAEARRRTPGRGGNRTRHYGPYGPSAGSPRKVPPVAFERASSR